MAKEDATDTPPKEPAKEVDWEKRYKDAQSELTKKSQAYKAEIEEHAKDKELLDQVTPHIDWASVNGEKKSMDDELVSMKDLNSKFEEIKRAQSIDRATSEFRLKYPDMVDYEDQVGFYLQNKTDPRHKMSDRIEKAVEYTKSFLETERAKGVSSSKEKTEEAKKKEAEASGLKEQDQKKVDTSDEEGETAESYVAWRKDLHSKGQGIAQA